MFKQPHPQLGAVMLVTVGVTLPALRKAQLCDSRHDHRREECGRQDSDLPAAAADAALPAHRGRAASVSDAFVRWHGTLPKFKVERPGRH